MERYVKNNKLAFFLVFSAILTGTSVGAFSLLKLDSNTSQSLFNAINYSVLNNSLFTAFTKSLSTEFFRFLILVLSGTTIFGAPICVAYLGFLGYSIGFSVSFLMKNYGLAGFISVIFGIIPHYLILLPTFACVGVISMNFSNDLILGDKKLKYDFKLYTAKMVFFAVLIFLSCIIEGFVSSLLLKKILLLI